MTELNGNVLIWIGIVGILIAFVFLKFISDKQHFRYTFLVSHLLIALGLMSSEKVNFWIGFFVFLLWFVAAFYVVLIERKERRKVGVSP